MWEEAFQTHFSSFFRSKPSYLGKVRFWSLDIRDPQCDLQFIWFQTYLKFESLYLERLVSI